jgi:hypothetical protein
MTTSIRFEFVLTYLGYCIYEVYGDGPSYRIQLRQRADAYERSIFAGTDAEWQRDIVAAIGLLHRCDGQPISQPVVDAFNDWRAARHASDVAHLRAHPERYGSLSESDPVLVAPAPVRGARYLVGTGWVEIATHS